MKTAVVTASLNHMPFLCGQKVNRLVLLYKALQRACSPNNVGCLGGDRLLSWLLMLEQLKTETGVAESANSD